MKSFTLKIMLFLLIQGGLFIAVFHRYRQIARNDYMMALVDKLDRLERLPAPRLILAGGSGMAFGVDSESLEREFGMPTVNMGLHAFLSLDFQLNTLKPFLRQGDVVVLSFEYESLGGLVAASQLLQIAAFRPSVLAFVDWSQGRNIVDELHLFVGGVVRSVVKLDRRARWDSDTIYSRKEFDAYGDFRSRHRRVSLWTDDPAVATGGNAGKKQLEMNAAIHHPVSQKQLERSIRSLRSFVAFSARKGATVCYSFPPQAEPRMEQMRPTLEACERAVAGCDGLILLDRPFDGAYPWEEFYDTHYHLTAMGMARRTKALIANLRPVLAALREDRR